MEFRDSVLRHRDLNLVFDRPLYSFLFFLTVRLQIGKFYTPKFLGFRLVVHFRKVKAIVKSKI